MKKITIATHSGTFHPDEVFSLAVLKLVFEKENKQIEIIRTRDLEKIAFADMAVDVGEEYDLSKNRFDHHQKGRAGKRENGIPYASFGLIWKHFGIKLTSNNEAWKAIDKKLVMPIDALDNGINLSTSIFPGIRDYSIYHVLSAIGSTYSEDKAGESFEKAIEIASMVLAGEIKKTENKIEGERHVYQEILKQKEPDYLVLEKYSSWEVIVSKFNNIKLVIYPDSSTDNWCLQVARDNVDVFGEDRINFPESWRGLSGADLVSITEIPGSVFCHAGGFYASVKSKDDAIQMANKVIYRE